VAVRKFHRAVDFLDAYVALPRVQHPLAATLGADPDAVAAELGERCRGSLALQSIGARYGLERQAQAMRAQRRRVAVQPRMADGEHVIGVPQLLGGIAPDDL